MALSGVGQYKTVDPAFVRDAKAEADAIKRGMTAAYIEERGGVNASGYYGDSWVPFNYSSDSFINAHSKYRICRYCAKWTSSISRNACRI